MQEDNETDNETEDVESAATAIDSCLSEMREMQDRAVEDIWGSEDEE